MNNRRREQAQKKAPKGMYRLMEEKPGEKRLQFLADVNGKETVAIFFSDLEKRGQETSFYSLWDDKGNRVDF